MQIATATWRNGQVQLLEGVDWAEGTQLRVSPVASTGADHDWHVQNARRLELITKEVHTELSNAERAELERLQDAAAKVCEPDDIPFRPCPTGHFSNALTRRRCARCQRRDQRPTLARPARSARRALR